MIGIRPSEMTVEEKHPMGGVANFDNQFHSFRIYFIFVLMCWGFHMLSKNQPSHQHVIFIATTAGQRASHIAHSSKKEQNCILGRGRGFSLIALKEDSKQGICLLTFI